MKPKKSLRAFIALAGSSLLAFCSASAQSTLYWDGGTVNIGTDGNGASAGGAGTWNTTLTNWDAGVAPHVAWDNTSPFDTAVLGGTSGTVTLGTSISVDTININTAGYAISPSATNQLTVSTINVAGGGTSSFGAAGTVNIGGSLLTVTTATAADRFSFAQEGSTNSTRITLNGGTAATSISGPGYVNFRLVANNTTGGISISGGGTVLLNNTIADSLGTNNLTINGGQVSTYTSSAITRALGTGASQIQITGGVSGFDTTGTVTFNNNAATEVVWGSAVFDPTSFVLSSATLANNTNLSGADRTVQVRSGTTGTMSGVIRTSSGTAGLTKTGAGVLVLSNTANTYNGITTINSGILTARLLANGGSNSSIGSSSNAASNLVIGNGATFRYDGSGHSTNRGFTINGTADGHGASLDASGTGAANWTNTASPAYGTVDQSRTLTLTGTNTGNNTLAANIANNGTGAVSINKTGAGLWVLSGTNSYTGGTTLSGGTLSVGVAGNLGDASSDLVFNGGTLQITGTGLTNFASLGRTNPLTFTSGQTVGLDIADVNNVFTAGQVLNQGTGGLTKAGAGTLVLNQANTYSGLTTISAGTLRLDTGGSIAGSVINNSIYLVNQNATTGTGPLASFTGSGSIAAGPSSTITINSPTGLQSNALNTTGGGSFSLSGVGMTAPTFGGLVGATGNLSGSFSSGYTSGVINLTLDTRGNSFTYGGVINDGATGMDLTKSGAGTQILQGANTYTGETNINAGTITLSGASGALASTTINLNGGGLTLDNSTNSGARVSDSATVYVNGNSALNFSHAGASATDYAETMGALSLQSGFLTYTGSQANSTGPRSSNVLFNTLSRSGTATVNFAGTGLGTNVRNTIKFDSGVTNGVDLGPWAVVNGADFASYSTANGVVAATNTTLAAGSNSSTTNFNTTAGSVTITAALNPSYKTLLVTGGTARTTAINGNTVSVGGISSTGATHIISGTGAVQALSAGDALYVNVGANTLQFDSVIQNVGAGATASALVKYGTGILILGNSSNSYSGGTVVNAGALQIAADGNLGSAGTGITFNGSGTLTNSTGTTLVDLGARTLTLNNGAIATITGSSRGNIEIDGAITGTGGVTLSYGSFWGKTALNSTSNTFEGALTLTGGNDDGNSLFSINSIADGAGYGNIVLNVSSSENDPIALEYGTGGTNGTGGGGAIAPLVLDNRQIVVQGTSTNVFNNSSNQAVTINTDIGYSGTGARFIRFGNSRAGSGINTFAGKLTDNVGGALNVTAGGGTWIFSGANTYTGGTTVSAGTLRIGSNSVGAVGSVTSSAVGTGALTLAGGGISSNNTTARTILNPVTFTSNATLGDTTNTGKLTFSADAALGGATRTLTLNSDAEFAGIVSSSGAFGITKAGAGTLRLSNTNTYTGVTTISAGVLEASVLANGGSNSSIGASANTATNLSLANGTTFRYIGSSNVTTDRGFQVNGTAAGHGATIESSGTGTLAFDNTVAINWGTNNQTRTFTLGGTNTGANTMGKVIGNNGTGATSLVKSGSGTWVVNQSNTYTGSTAVNDGVLEVSAGSINTTSSVTITGGTLKYDSSTGLNRAVTVNGGTFRYNSSVAYSGALTYTSGTVGGTNLTGNLDGLNINAGKTLSPGNSPGIASTGSQTWGTDGSYLWEINNAAGAQGTNWDVLSGTGTLTVGATSVDPFTILVTSLQADNSAGDALNFNNASGYEWLIADFTNAVSGFDLGKFVIDDSAFSNALNGSFNIALGDTITGGDNTQIYLTYTAIPEPGAALLGGIGILLILRRRR